MSLTASKLTMGWTGVTATPGTGTPVTIDEVTEVTVDKKAVQKKFFGDVSPYASMIVVRERSREVSIKSGNVAKLASIIEGDVYSLAATLNDARNGSGAGAITLTLGNAVCVSNPFAGAANEFAQGTITFASYSLDGTDPLTLTVT